MAGLSITGQMKVSTLQKGFLKEFGLTLRVYDGREFADPSQTLSKVRKTKGSGKALSVAKNMKVVNLEDKFEKEFGLKVQVAGSDDSYLCKNALTLNAAQQEDEKKLARKERKAARQAEVSTDSNDDGDDASLDHEKDDLDRMLDDMDDDLPKKSVRLTFNNVGGEFQYHRLNKEDSEFLKNEFALNKDSFLETNLQGGESFEEAIWPGSYGPSLHDIEIINDEDNKKIDLDKVNKNQIFFTDGNNDLRKSCLDYFYITEGKIFGSYTVNLRDGEIFDPEKLTINYIEYGLDGYPEKFGTIIHEVEYDGETCDMEIEDSGVENYRCIIGYELLEGELEDYIVIYDSDNQTTWKWDLCDGIFENADEVVDENAGSDEHQSNAETCTQEAPNDPPSPDGPDASDEGAKTYFINHNKSRDACSIIWEADDHVIGDLEPYIYAIQSDDGEDLHDLINADWPDADGKNDFKTLKLNNFQAVEGDEENEYFLCFTALISTNLDNHPNFKKALEKSGNQVVAKIQFKKDGKPILDEDGYEKYLYEMASDTFVEFEHLVC